MIASSPPPRLILASSSAYRRELLGRLRLPFEVILPDVDESPLPGEAPETTALRLARFFGTSEQFWLNLQNRYDLERERDRLGDRLNDIEVWTGLACGA